MICYSEVMSAVKVVNRSGIPPLRPHPRTMGQYLPPLQLAQCPRSYVRYVCHYSLNVPVLSDKEEASLTVFRKLSL
ncbi:hypothetical protein J6590_016391 [Homalodisca vitripennis]|nr:hypothetical protein J6590_016391 [Homalodisca vitripennis]